MEQKKYNAEDLREKIVKKFGSVGAFAIAIGRKKRDVSRVLYMIDYRLNRSKFKKREEQARQDFEELEKLCNELSAKEERKEITNAQRIDLHHAINLAGKSATEIAESINVSKSTIYSILSGEQKYITKQVAAIFEKLFIA